MGGGRLLYTYRGGAGSLAGNSQERERKEDAGCGCGSLHFHSLTHSSGNTKSIVEREVCVDISRIKSGQGQTNLSV